VAILCDADVDGQHIRTLLYTLFFRLMRPMIEAGRLFVAQAPLYQLRRGSETVYAYSDTERDRILSKWSKGRVNLQRYKGLGEMNPSQLRETVFALGDGDNPALNRHLVRVRIEDAHAANEAVGLWMGGSAARRRKRLMRYWNETSIGIDNGNGTGGAEEEEEDNE
jgi:DNA gyrase subunit B